MSILSGNNGTLRLGATEIAPVSNWKLVSTSQHREYAANDTGGWKKRVRGVEDSSGSFELKATDDGHCPIAEGDAVTLQLHVDKTGNNYYQVPAVIDKIGVDVAISAGGTVAYAVSFAGNGPIARHGIVANAD